MSATDQRRIHALVSGRVQGVYYRASTQAEAQRLGLSGWVRNLGDGRVELQAQGPHGAVDRLLTWLLDGPPAAAVAEVETVTQELLPGEKDFKVRR